MNESCSAETCRKKAAAAWVFQVVAAAILAQTLFFKFTAAPESVWIFTKLGMEPWGRIGSGVVELAAVVLLLTSRGAVYGAVVASGVMAGAIVSHLATLGIEVEGDGGLLFALALTVLASCGVVLFLRRSQVAAAAARLKGRLGVRPA